jgi:CHAD domain-containing protein
MLEEERKYDVGVAFGLPDLKPCLPKGGKVVKLPARTLRATYYDTPTARLARSGVSIRYRSGETGKPPWTVKLPTAGVGTRDEITAAGSPKSVPAELLALLTVYRRGAPLAPAVTIRTLRRAYELRDRTGRLLAEVADDTVSVLDGRAVVGQFREIEVERAEGTGKLLDRVEAVLLTAGANRGEFLPKHARAMGDRATGPPDLAEPEQLPPAAKATTADVIVTAIRKHVAKIFQADPYLRMREPMPDGDTSVHQMRVGCRRLRSDLRTFRPLLDPQWADNLRAGAGWLAEVLGAARDAEVLRTRLHRTAAADPVAPIDPAALARFDADLTARHEDALQALDEALASDRYATLLDVLVEAAREPQLGEAAQQPAAAALTRLVAKPWRQLATTGRDRIGAGDLDPIAKDDDWHAVRIRGKRARYAVEAVAKLIGGDAAALADALTEVQELLGEHQDAAVAADTWLAIARSDVDDHALAVAAGRLVERERAAVRRARERFPTAWAAANTPGQTGWLHS